MESGGRKKKQIELFDVVFWTAFESLNQTLFCIVESFRKKTRRDKNEERGIRNESKKEKHHLTLSRHTDVRPRHKGQNKEFKGKLGIDI